MSEKIKEPDKDDLFLINEGFDLLAAFRAIKCTAARKAIIMLAVSVVEAESAGHEQPVMVSDDDSTRFDH